MKPTTALLLIALAPISLAVASEKSDYAAASKSHTVEAYEQFLAKYPNSRRRRDVQYFIGKLSSEELVWKLIQQAPTQELINEYKSRFFDGRHLAEVTGKYQKIVDRKNQPPKKEIHEIVASRPATDDEVSAITADIQHRISPFTLDQVRSGGGGARTEDRNGKAVTVSVQTMTVGDFIRSDFFVKEGAGGVSLSDSLSGEVGEHVLTLRRQKGEPDTMTVPNGSDVYTEYQQATDGQWMVRKFRVVEVSAAGEPKQ